MEENEGDGRSPFSEYQNFPAIEKQETFQKDYSHELAIIGNCQKETTQQVVI